MNINIVKERALSKDAEHSVSRLKFGKFYTSLTMWIENLLGISRKILEEFDLTLLSARKRPN